MSWEYNSGSPLYCQLRDRIREDIINGVYLPNERLPGVRDLACTAGVNPNTMQKALGELELEGMVVTKGTSGRTVTGDTGIIENAKKKILSDITNGFIRKMSGYGVCGDELIRLVEETAAESEEQKQ